MPAPRNGGECVARPPRDTGSAAPARWVRRRRLGRARRYSDLRRSSRLHSCRSVLGLIFLRHQSLQPHAPGSSPQHVRCRRQGLLAQKRNDPSNSHCARRIKSLRTRDGRASHSSSVSRPGKLRVPTGRRRAITCPLKMPCCPLKDVLLRHAHIHPRDAATHPSFAYAKKSQAKKRRQKNSSLKRREAERR
jgi:hypothetical protein